MSSPNHERLRRHEVLAWLLAEGISDYDARKLLENGVIKAQPLFADGRNYYFKSQIQRDVLDKHSHTGNQILLWARRRGER